MFIVCHTMRFSIPVTLYCTSSMTLDTTLLVADHIYTYSRAVGILYMCCTHTDRLRSVISVCCIHLLCFLCACLVCFYFVVLWSNGYLTKFLTRCNVSLRLLLLCNQYWNIIFIVINWCYTCKLFCFIYFLLDLFCHVNLCVITGMPEQKTGIAWKRTAVLPQHYNCLLPLTWVWFLLHQVQDPG